MRLNEAAQTYFHAHRKTGLILMVAASPFLIIDALAQCISHTRNYGKRNHEAD